MKVAFVTPWYGDIPGGAENECKRTAENLKEAGVDAEILTTCAKEFLSNWNHNFYQEGTYDVNGVTVRRFEIKHRDTHLFDRINYMLMCNKKISLKEENQYITENINSDNLCQYISKNKSNYDYFIFMPYMFGTTYFGSKICPEKSVLIPCLHDESYAYLNIYKDLFKNVRGLIFHAEAEEKLAKSLFDLSGKKLAVLGEGIDTDIDYNGERFRKKYGLKEEFILYAGRRESGKNVPLLIDYFCKYHKKNNAIKLVLIGSGEVSIPGDHKEGIIDLGYIPKQDKYDAYAAATILCQPSLNESFSIVIMEAWLCGTPVLVHARCEVTKDHCVRYNGGLYFSNYEEFEGCVNLFMQNPNICRKMGLNGKKSVIENYNWDIIVNKYKKILRDWGENSANSSDLAVL